MCATIGGMGVREIGKYLRDSIQENGLTIAAVTAAAEVEANYIWRLENGQIKKPGVQTLKRLTTAAQGAWEVVSDLLNGADNPTPDPRQAFKELAESLTDDEMPDAVAAIQRMRTNRRRQRKPRGAQNDGA